MHYTQAQISAPTALTDTERRELDDMRAILKSDREREERERQIRRRDELKFKDEWEAAGRPVPLHIFIEWKNGSHDIGFSNVKDWARAEDNARALGTHRDLAARAALDRDRRTFANRYHDLFAKELAAERPIDGRTVSIERGYSR